MNERINFLKFFYESGKYAEDHFSTQIIDLFPAMVFIYDLEAGKVVFGNRRFSSYFGYSSYDLKDEDNILPALVDSEDWIRFDNELRRFVTLNEDETLTFDCKLKSASNGSAEFNVMATVLRRGDAGSAVALLMICQPASETREDAGLSKLFDETEELLHFGSWTLQPGSEAMTWTQGLSLMLGYDKKAQSQTLSTFAAHISEFDRKHFEDCLAKSLNSGNDFSLEYCVKTRSGEEKNFSTRAKVVRNSKGSIDHLLGITSDVTELRQFEMQQERAIRELNRSNQELEEFAYVASHDMQEPLRKISMFGERLQGKLKGKLDEESENYLNRILASANNMKALIDHLLEFSRTNRRAPDFRRCDMGEILIQVLSDLELKIEESKARVDLDGKLPVIEASPTDLIQLFSNLLSNAIKFRKSDAAPVVKIVVKKLSFSEKANLRLRKDRVYFRFDVLDNGIGFEQEYADRIFLIFQRLNGKSEYPGSGIGLAICKKITDNHNGMIFASSEIGKGSTFSIILPEKQF